MTESRALNLNQANVQKDELSKIGKSNTICTAVACITMISGLPALIISHLWTMLGMAAILQLPGVSESVVFKLFYVYGLAFCTMPLMVLGGISLLGRNIERFGSRFVIDADGMRWEANSWIVRLLLKLTRYSTKPISWDKPVFLVGDELPMQLKKDYGITVRKKLWTEDWESGRIRFLETGKTGALETLCSLRLAFLSEESRKQIMAAIKRFSPDLKITKSVTEALLGTSLQERDLKYTEIWIQLLQDHRNRPRKPDCLALNDTVCDGRYRVQQKIATGGQANLYRAKDLCCLSMSGLESSDGEVGTHSNDSVVLKEYIISTASDASVMQGLEEFETESSIMRAISHDNICKILDIFVDDGRAYLVLEDLGGDSLRRFVEEHGPLDEGSALRIARQVCQAVSYLHALSVIHRDISPDNIILCNGEVKIVDFSVATRSESNKIGQVVGKPAYISADQFRGFSKKSNDIYAIGATLHFLLTGQDPAPISCSEPKKINDKVSSELSDLVARCTALNADEGFSSIEELLAQLQSIQPPVRLVSNAHHS